MRTRMVRMGEEDIALVTGLSGLEANVPFATKMHAVLRRLIGPGRDGELEAVRRIVREELERVAGGA